MTDYAIDFRTLAADSSWNASALYDAFYNGLSERIKDELAARDPPKDVNALIDLSIRIDQRLRDRRRERGIRGPNLPPAFLSASSPPPVKEPTPFSVTDPEPMQLGRSKLSQAERERRMSHKLCLYCGQSGHMVRVCPVKGGAQEGTGGPC